MRRGLQHDLFRRQQQQQQQQAGLCPLLLHAQVDGSNSWGSGQQEQTQALASRPQLSTTCLLPRLFAKQRQGLLHLEGSISISSKVEPLSSSRLRRM
jgi:hypothetical protein